MVTSIKPNICIITPVYNEEAGLETYAREVRRVLLEPVDMNMRVLFVDDGSQDNSWQVIQKICQEDSRFSGIRLSRNFGSHVALSAGIRTVECDALCTLACDLQDPPEVILSFLEKWRRGAQIVWGKRRSRQEKSWRIFASTCFHVLLKRYAMPKESKFATGSFFLIDRMVITAFRQFHEQNRITFALVAWTGFLQEEVEYDRHKRMSGTSSWNLSKMLKAMYDAFVGFSMLPVRLITFTGFLLFFLALCLTIIIVIQWFHGIQVAGWGSLMASMLLLFGLLFLMLGVMGEYLSRIYAEVVQRPLYFISEHTSNFTELP